MDFHARQAFEGKAGNMTGGEQLAAFASANYRQTVTKVGERVYHFLGFGHSNATAIVGDTSIILVDALDSPGYAAELNRTLKVITAKPVKTIIYTHGHPDHRGGAGYWRDSVEEVIAHVPVHEPLEGYERISSALERRGARQHGYGLSDEEAICQGIGMREGHETGAGGYDFLAPTKLLDGDLATMEIDGVALELRSAPGETDDAMLVWLPDDSALCSGDVYYATFPNLYAIRGTQYRDVAQWVRALDLVLSYPAEALLPGHTAALIGHGLIQEQVGAYRDAMRFLLDGTLAAIEAGLTEDEAAEAVRLPEELAAKPFLGEFYGMVEWAVRSIYVGYVGWFDGDPAKLLPLAEDAWRGELRALIGDRRLENRTLRAIDEGEYQLALQLLALWKPTRERTRLLAMALRGRAEQVTSANARHYYFACAHELDEP